MPIANKPDEKVFASNAKRGEVEAFPDILRGWGITFDQTQGIPPMEWFNALFQRNDNAIAYFLQRGLPEWSATQDYPRNGYVQYNGLTYRALRQNKGQKPDVANSQNWTRWGMDYHDLEQLRQQAILKTKKSDAVNSTSSDTVATSRAAKTAYDKAQTAQTAAEAAQRTANAKQSPQTTLAGYGIGDFKVQSFVNITPNAITTAGNYYLQNQNAQDLPRAGNWFLWVNNYGTGAVYQILKLANSTETYERQKHNGRWSEWKRTDSDGIPLGSIVSFPTAIVNPAGFLKCDGTTFSQSVYPDLYRTLGSNQLPNLNRSDVGTVAWFAVDNIPQGWIAFDEIATINEQNYPKLHRTLIAKYGSLRDVPKVADRFIRNAGNGLTVGQVQEDAIKRHSHHMPVNHSLKDNKHFNNEAIIKDVQAIDTLMNDRNGLSDNALKKPLLTSQMAEGGDENRPKSLILKLCIKAQDNFEDVQFWIKAYGEVTNAGNLDASGLALAIQSKADRDHTHTVAQITDFNAKTDEKINARIQSDFSYQKIGNFEIRKFPDGTMIQTCIFHRGDTTFNRTCSDGENNTVIYPQAFISMPTVSVTPHLSHPYFDGTKSTNDKTKRLGSRNHEADSAIGLTIDNNERQCQFVYSNSDVYISEMSFHITAIGRWK